MWMAIWTYGTLVIPAEQQQTTIRIFWKKQHFPADKRHWLSDRQWMEHSLPQIPQAWSVRRPPRASQATYHIQTSVFFASSFRGARMPRIELGSGVKHQNMWIWPWVGAFEGGDRWHLFEESIIVVKFKLHINSNKRLPHKKNIECLFLSVQEEFDNN